jgi:hypothetical protein
LDDEWFGWDTKSKSFKKKDICSDDSCSLPQSKANPIYFEDNFIDNNDRFPVETRIEEPEFDITKEKPLCINCFHDLESDNFGSYYCSGCNDWFSENEVKSKNINHFNF